MRAATGFLLSSALLLVASSAAARDRVAWSRRVGPTAGSVALAVDSGVVVTVTWVGDVVALDAATGRVRWRSAAPGPPRPLLTTDTMLGVAGGVAVLGRFGSASLDGLDLATGRLRWHRDLGGAPTSVAACPGFRLVAATHRTADASFVATALDPATGALIWEVPATGPISATDDEVLFTSDPSPSSLLSGTLRAIRCDDGQSRAIRTDGLQFPVVVDADGGRALVVDRNGTGALLAPLDGGRSRGLPPEIHPPGTPLGALRGDRRYRVYGSLAEHRSWRLPDPEFDAALSLSSLANGALLARSPERTADVEMLMAGSQLVTSHGRSGAQHVVYMLDPDDLRVIGEVSTVHSARALVADERRVYATQWDGSVIAITLPRPGPPRAQRILTPREPRAAARPRATTFSVVAELVIGRGPMREPRSRYVLRGDALAFVGGGDFLAAGGSNERVRIFRVNGGAPVWASPPLGTDVEHLAAGGRRLAARVYDNLTWVWEIDAQGHGREVARLPLPHGLSLAMSPSGGRVAADDPGGGVAVLAVPSGNRLVAAPTAGTPDDRAMVVRGRWLVRRVAGDRIGIVDLDALQAPALAGSIPLPPAPETASFSQAWSRNGTELVLEWCAPAWCEVQLLGVDGRTRARARFDATGVGWAPGIPSMLDVSADGAWLF
jgi:outer membrane protein assembly factor BamB